MPWLIGIVVIAAFGYYLVKRTEAAASQLGTTVTNSLADQLKSHGMPTTGQAATITHVTIDANSTPQGASGQISMDAAGSLVVQAYDPPVGYRWLFATDGTPPLAMATPSSTPSTSATFYAPIEPPGGYQGAVVMATLVRISVPGASVAVVAPKATYRYSVTVTPMIVS